MVKFGDRIYDNPMDNGRFGGLSFGAVYRTPDDDHTTYIVRMYYVKKDNAGNNGPMYYVVENTITANPTVSINELNTDNVVSRTYYNAQGVASSKPFSGVNIVVTRYSDGSTKTTKVVK